MSIADREIKILWGRAAGVCSHPECEEDLTAIVGDGAYSVGEMAHVISTKAAGPRGSEGKGTDTYENLILLCPTHHRHVDKAPAGTFTADLLHGWKDQHEEKARNVGDNLKFATFKELAAEVYQLLCSNKSLFDELGPKSKTAQRNPGSNLATVWELRRLDRIIPNNRRILMLIDNNRALLPPSLPSLVEMFRTHAEAYAEHVNGALDSYPLFPEVFAKEFSNEQWK